MEKGGKSISVNGRNRMMEKRGKLHPGNWRYRIIENEGIESGRVAYRLRGMDL